jgi:hypothetical protein
MPGWCRAIADRLHLGGAEKKLVVDKTGILLDERFVNYLLDRGINFQIAKEQLHVVWAAQSNPDLIITPTLEIPSSVSKKRDVIYFDYSKLPIEIEPSTAALLHVDELINLIAHHVEYPDGTLITKENLDQKLHASAAYQSKASLVDLSRKIRLLAYHIEDYKTILKLGELWGEYLYLCFIVDENPDADLQQMVDDGIRQAVIEDGKLKNAFYEPESKLRSVDKIRGYLKSLKDHNKIALVCFDGMGVAEWHVLRSYLSDCNFSYAENFMLSLVPTMTKIARSSIFYGDYLSVYTLKSPNEEKQFKESFANRNCRFYREGDISCEDDLLGVDMASVIYNFFDDLGHHTQLPDGYETKALYFENILNYLRKSKIGAELQLLKKLGYRMFFCSDHGCVVAQGNGKKIDKYLVEEASKRSTLIEKSQLSEFYDVDHYEVPFSKNKVALLAKGRTIFASKKLREISHGGITAEELVVPFVEVVA